jgi:predicted  nucleic acid-binding Zn-ribbon protein
MSKTLADLRKGMQEHLKDLSRLALKGSIKHSELVTKHTNHSHNLLKIYTESKAENKRLHNVIDIKQREIDDLNKQNTDLLWHLANLQKDNGSLQEYKDNNETQLAHYESKLKKLIKNGKDN